MKTVEKLKVLLMLETMTSFPPTSAAAARHAGKQPGGEGVLVLRLCVDLLEEGSVFCGCEEIFPL